MAHDRHLQEVGWDLAAYQYLLVLVLPCLDAATMGTRFYEGRRVAVGVGAVIVIFADDPVWPRIRRSQPYKFQATGE